MPRIHDVKREYVSDKMADKLTKLCMEAMHVNIVKTYEMKSLDATDGDSYANYSNLITETTSALQKILDKLASDPKLSQNVRKDVEAIEEKLEKVAMQNIFNEQLVNANVLCCSKLADNKHLKDSIIRIIV